MPSLAYSRKQMRHISKSRMYPRFLPQRKQRRTTRDLNFGVRAERAMVDFLAIQTKKFTPSLKTTFFMCVGNKTPTVTKKP